MVERSVVQLGNFAAYMLYICRFVSLATMGYGGEVGAVGLEKKQLSRELCYLFAESRILECHNATHAEVYLAHLSKP